MSTELEVHNEIAPIAEAWDELADEANVPPFLRPGWFRAWLNAFGTGRLIVLVIRRGGRLVGVMPLSRRAGVLGSPTNWHTPLYGPVAADQEALRAILGGILSQRPRRIDLSFLDGGGSVARELRELSGSHHCVERRMMQSPYLPIEGDWETYWQGVSGKLRQTVRRCSRRLAEIGEISLQIESGAERLDDLLAEGLRVEASNWKGRSGTAIASDPRTVRFYTELARWAAAQGVLRFAFLRVGGRALAFHFALESKNKYYLLKPGYNEEFKKAGPGTVLTQKMVERSFSLGLDSYEFLGADDEHKMRWTSEVRPRVRIQAFAPSPAGAVDRVIQTHGRALAKRLTSVRA
ncbi:MAG TPA: GNAT family N-acetyltransferase [Solirubrobacterales bacterium]|nr:GNAT family N-acetyltransferase [Solirubrobacterales bacterium]